MRPDLQPLPLFMPSLTIQVVESRQCHAKSGNSVASVKKLRSFILVLFYSNQSDFSYFSVC